MIDYIYMSILDIRVIKVRYENDPDDSPYKNGKETIYHLHKDDVDKMILSILKLHHTPGLNPHNKKLDKTQKVKLILLETPCEGLYLSHWWTSPDLLNNHNGAKVIGFDVKEIYMSSAVHAQFLLQINDELYTEAYDTAIEEGPSPHEKLIGCYIDEQYFEYIDPKNDIDVKILLY